MKVLTWWAVLQVVITFFHINNQIRISQANESSESSTLCQESKNTSSSSSSSSSCSSFLSSSCLNDNDTDVHESIYSQLSSNDDSIKTTNWHYGYISPETTFRMIDKTTDERLGNLMRAANTGRQFYFHFYKIDSPFPDSLNNSHIEQLAAGSKVNDSLCREHLVDILSQMDEMSNILESRRQGDNSIENTFQEKHIRLTEVLDSFGRYESGLLNGKLWMFGSFNQCSKSRMLLNEKIVSGRYCVANFDVAKYQDAELKLFKQANLDKEPNEDLISVGICLPESCHTKSTHENMDLIEKLIRSQFELPSNLYQDTHLPIESVYCQPDSDSPLLQIPFSGKLLLLFISIWLVSIIYSTYSCNYLTNNNKTLAKSSTLNDQKSSSSSSPSSSSSKIMSRFNLDSEKIMQCLNLKNSWDDFTCSLDERNFNGPKHRVSLDTLNPIKVLGSMLVVLGHSMLLHSGFASDIIAALQMMQTDPKAFFILGITVIVDTFYVITGIIITYASMKKMNNTRKNKRKLLKKDEDAKMEILAKNQKQAIMKSNANMHQTTYERVKEFLAGCFIFISSRYLRIIPLYFLVFWLRKSNLMAHMSNGPFWDHGFNKQTDNGNCRQESWLSPFTFQAAYLPLPGQCLPQAWSVAGDLFFSFIMAPIIMLIWQKPIMTATISVILCIVSNLSLLISYRNVDSDLLYDVLDLELIGVIRVSKIWSTLYTEPHNRVFSIIVGILAGYVLYNYSLAKKDDDDDHHDDDDDDKSSTIRMLLRRWPNWFKFATKISLWYIVFALCSTPLIPILRQPFPGATMLYRLLVMHLGTTNRLFWAISNAIVFLRMVTDWKDTYLMQNCSTKFWSSMAKLNLALLLIHVDLLKLDAYLQLNSIDYSFFGVVRLFTSAYMMCLLIATLLYVLFESPMDKLLKYITNLK